MDLKNIDAADFSSAFERWIEDEYPTLSEESIAERSRMVMNFIEAQQVED